MAFTKALSIAEQVKSRACAWRSRSSQLFGLRPGPRRCRCHRGVNAGDPFLAVSSGFGRHGNVRVSRRGRLVRNALTRASRDNAEGQGQAGYNARNPSRAHGFPPIPESRTSLVSTTLGRTRPRFGLRREQTLRLGCRGRFGVYCPRCGVTPAKQRRSRACTASRVPAWQGNGHPMCPLHGEPPGWRQRR